MRVYLDACCLSRPFDDQGQERIRLEAEAILVLLELRSKGRLTWVASDVLADEIARITSVERRALSTAMMGQADEFTTTSGASIERARQLVRGGLSGMDALHVAAAEHAACDVLVTTDDRLESAARRNPVKVEVVNPVPLALRLVKP